MFADFSETIFSAMVAFGVGGLVIDGLYQVAPKPRTANAFEVHSISAERVGDGIEIDFDRSIYMPIVMGFTVRVQEDVAGGYRQFCKMSSPPFQYQPDAVLPDVIDMVWWSDGKCPDVPDGATRISTTWTPSDPKYKPITKIFEVEPKE